MADDVERFCRAFMQSLRERTTPKKRQRGPKRVSPASHTQQLLDILAVVGGLRNACIPDKVFLDSAVWRETIQCADPEGCTGLAVVGVLGCAVVLHSERLGAALDADLSDGFKRFLFVDVASGNHEPRPLHGSERLAIVERVVQSCCELREKGDLEEMADQAIAPTLIGVLLGYPVVYVASDSTGGNCLGSRDIYQHTVSASLSPWVSSILQSEHTHAIFCFTCPMNIDAPVVSEELARLQAICERGDSACIWSSVELQSAHIVHPSITL